MIVQHTHKPNSVQVHQSNANSMHEHTVDFRGTTGPHQKQLHTMDHYDWYASFFCSFYDNLTRIQAHVQLSTCTNLTQQTATVAQWS